MQLRQSDLKVWGKCPLAWRFANIDKLAREQSCALTFGSILHDCVLFMEVQQDLAAAQARFRQLWTNPELLDPEYRIDYYLPRRSWKKYHDEGLTILHNWWGIIQWESDVIIGRELSFTVPIGEHELHGTIDKLALRYLGKTDEWVVLVSDYKTSVKMPTYDYLSEDLQFSAYCYATLQKEFWAGVPNGEVWREQTEGLRRMGEWVQLRGPQRRDAGERVERHFNRLSFAIDQISTSIGLRIFVPNISGENCLYCEFRGPCGLPEVMTA